MNAFLAVRTSALSSLTLSEPHARLGVIEEFILRASSASCTLRTVTALLVIGLLPRASMFRDRVHVDPGGIRDPLLIDLR